MKEGIFMKSGASTNYKGVINLMKACKEFKVIKFKDETIELVFESGEPNPHVETFSQRVENNNKIDAAKEEKLEQLKFLEDENLLIEDPLMYEEMNLKRMR
jgi:Ni,Fe-hydrogenase I large subunit